ncbi:exocyst complex component 3-like protein [Tachyglossus aculeatus]|uniref:exocyst complex component 3-like protein n=1 Tax=Tachyglossus aculeatus TaxID=9261 RepID=UPI0018F40D24|nr:exocyst complex component 3-like protein [Tachyglossus aculeatus]
MGTPAEEEQESRCPQASEAQWLEVEKAERLARGAALKWASGVFYRPEQLAGLAQYRIREAQRTQSLQARIKSTVQSYLEGVQGGLGHLRQALEEVRDTREALAAARGALGSGAEVSRALEPLRELAEEHKQLQVSVMLLPQLLAVPAAMTQIQALIRGRRLLEAHAELLALERLQEEVLVPLGGSPNPVLPLFQDLAALAEELGRAVGAAAGAARRLVREDPAMLVAAVRVAEREERRDAQLQPPPPGRPRAWRQRCLQALRQALEEAHFGAPPPEPSELPTHLAGLQAALPDELAAAEALLAPCVPGHYGVVGLCARTLHYGLTQHLRQLLDRGGLGARGTFTLLHWALKVYPGPDMMGRPDLSPEAGVAGLEPLLAPEIVEQLERTYVEEVQASVAEWLQKALKEEVAEWFREQEPETDPEGFYLSSLSGIVLQILDENIRVTALVSPSLQLRVRQMALEELGTLLHSLDKALGQFAQKHREDKARPCHYVPYLLSALNSHNVLSSFISLLQPEEASSPAPSLIATTLTMLQRKICRLLLEQLLEELQPPFTALLSHRWLSGAEPGAGLCELLVQFCSGFSRLRSPMAQLLLAESEQAVVLEYLRALMQGRLMCRSGTERIQVAERLLQDASQLRELFLDLGLEEAEQRGAVLIALQELLRLRDPALLGLEVSGFQQRFPDVSEEHISVLLAVRGDVSREQRLAVLDMMQANRPPNGRQPLFSLVPVAAPAPALSFCLPTGPCA